MLSQNNHCGENDELLPFRLRDRQLGTYVGNVASNGELLCGYPLIILCSTSGGIYTNALARK
jgi:hypothetical protein